MTSVEDICDENLSRLSILDQQCPRALVSHLSFWSRKKCQTRVNLLEQMQFCHVMRNNASEVNYLVEGIKCGFKQLLQSQQKLTETIPHGLISLSRS